MAVLVDDLAAVQAALEEAQCSLQDLELAWELQHQEFFGANSASSGSLEDNAVQEVKLAVEEQVHQLEERLQELKDAQLAQELHEQLLAKAGQLASDRQLAAAVGDRDDEGPTSQEVEALARRLPRRGGAGKAIQLCLMFEAEIKASEPGPAGCGAVLTSPGGEVLWQGKKLLESATHPQALLTAAALGLRAAASLGLCSSGQLVLQGSATAVLTELEHGGAAHSSAVGDLVSEVEQLLAAFQTWSVRRAGRGTVEQAARLAREALWPPHEGPGAEQAAQAGRGAQQDPAPAHLSGNHSCAICMENLSAAQFHVIGGCLHRFCRGCLRKHAQVVVRSRSYPVPCPHVGCSTPIAPAECELLLSASASDVAMFRQVETEASIEAGSRFYCPNPRCSAPFALGAEPEPDSPIFCPVCSTKICAACNIVWHKGFSCAEYQALPSTLRQPEDLATLRMAEHMERRRRWRQCAQCKQMIELGEGCRHMTCHCGFQFCFNCGKPWVPIPPGEPRPYGKVTRPTCNCQLFVAPPEPGEPYAEEEQGDDEPAGAGGGVPNWVPPHRRPVYKTVRCAYFPLGECRYGERCLFAHGGGELRVAHAGGSLPMPAHDGYDSDQ